MKKLINLFIRVISTEVITYNEAINRGLTNRLTNI
jgi:hypothetical protein